MAENKENSHNKDAMTSPAVEENKKKCPFCGEDIMTNPDAEEKKRECPSCGGDIMSIPTIQREERNNKK